MKPSIPCPNFSFPEIFGQLFVTFKVKSITGSTPVELLRTARLNHAYRLKEEYGMLPGEVRNQ